MGPLYVIRTGLAAEKKAARLSILLRILDGRQFSCLSNSEARFPMKSSHSLQRRRSTQVYPTLKGEFHGGALERPTRKQMFTSAVSHWGQMYVPQTLPDLTQ